MVDSWKTPEKTYYTPEQYTRTLMIKTVERPLREGKWRLCEKSIQRQPIVLPPLPFRPSTFIFDSISSPRVG